MEVHKNQELRWDEKCPVNNSDFHNFQETEELPNLFGNLDIRANAAATAQPGNNGALQSLLKIPKEPNYDNLKREILNQPTFAVSC